MARGPHSGPKTKSSKLLAFSILALIIFLPLAMIIDSAGITRRYDLICYRNGELYIDEKNLDHAECGITYCKYKRGNVTTKIDKETCYVTITEIREE